MENKEATGRLLTPLGYVPTALTDFSKPQNSAQMLHAIQKVYKERGKAYPLIIGKLHIETYQATCSYNPANIHPNEAVGFVSQADLKYAALAMETAKKAFAEWNETPVEKRAQVLRKAAEIVRQRRFDLAALMVLEASKNWREADGDVAEAIDFLEYYAGMATHLMQYRPTDQLPGESNDYGYEGRGVAVVISPWNFPMAIATGMCVAAIVAGNTVVFKPASSTSVIGYKIVEILLEAGLPAGVINYLPGSGGQLGEFLVKHPYTVNVLFTGSKQVGFQLIKWAGDAGYEQQTHCRRVIAEMGGKNAIIVDSTADLDQAVMGAVKSAFGYQGQKCSACSRLIVLESVYDEVVRRLAGATAVLKVGDPRHPGTDLGAVIDRKAREEISRYINIGKQEGARLVYEADVSELSHRGWFIGPVIFADVKPSMVIAREEIFGPVLSVIKAENFEEALKIANGCGYKLTGGLYSRTDEHIALARKNFKVGNLYLNRPITGAIVGRQPFGGFGASGTGPKAGGPDYLFQLMEARSITENLMRRGFSPDVKN